MSQAVMPKTKREWRKSYLQITPPGGTAAIWYVLGRDTDDMSREYSWEENDVLNVLGEFTSTNKVSGQSLTVDPFYARKGDPMSLWLYDADLKQKDLDDIKVVYGEVVIDLDAKEVISAFIRDAYILIQSAGGSSSDADSIPFNVKLIGKPIEADYNIATESFTATEAA